MDVTGNGNNKLSLSVIYDDDIISKGAGPELASLLWFNRGTRAYLWRVLISARPRSLKSEREMQSK